MAAISWIVPKMLEACVHVTSTVFSVSRSLRSDASSLGFVPALGDHHLMVRFWRAARSTQEAMLASWSTLEMMSSEPAGKESAKDKIRKRDVVEDPRTAYCKYSIEFMLE